MKISRLLIAGTMVTGIAVAGAAPALADNGHIGVRETICADSLQFRSGPNSGANDGTMYRGQTFLVEGRSGGYVSGFAYGDINRRGWVQDGWFC